MFHKTTCSENPAYREDRQTIRLTRIKSYLEILPREALQDIIDTPVAKWTEAELCTTDGRRCLHGIARDATMYDGFQRTLSRAQIEASRKIELIFDCFYVEGKPEVVIPQIQQHAAFLLAQLGEPQDGRT